MTGDVKARIPVAVLAARMRAAALNEDMPADPVDFMRALEMPEQLFWFRAASMAVTVMTEALAESSGDDMIVVEEAPAAGGRRPH